MKPFRSLLFLSLASVLAAAAPRPNILWITCEDTSPWFGFCGETYATTPHIDRLARQGVHYTNVYATAPVCSPCRSAVITGRFATSLGTQRLRSQFPIPDDLHGVPSYLRAAGYYCTNNVKTDYNTSAEARLIAESWDVSSAKAHWRGRQAGQPFFAIFNLMESHQSKVFGTNPVPGLEPAECHDPARAPLPPYYPDTSEARRTIARTHDCITAMDKKVGRILAELEADGLAEDTIVFFWPDHGQGIPRGKRTLWDSGLKVPLVVRFPQKFRALAPAAPGGATDRLIQLMDLGPTMLSIAQVSVPTGLDGRAFLGNAAAPARNYVYGARDRVDEATDISRSVRDGRYLYIRNYQPDLSWNQPEGFSDQLPLRRELATLAKAGRLNAAQLAYAGPTKALELLYDTQSDPWQVRNLADEPQHRPVLERMRKELRRWMVDSRDLGFLAEWQAQQLCTGGKSMVQAAADSRAYPLERVLDTADQVGRPGAAATFVRLLTDADPSVRYWAALGLQAAQRMAHAPDATTLAGPATQTALRQALRDPSLSVRLVAAGVLVSLADDRSALDLLSEFLRGSELVLAVDAARSLQLLGARARPALPAMRQMLAGKPDMYVEFALSAAVRELGPAN